MVFVSVQLIFLAHLTVQACVCYILRSDISVWCSSLDLPRLILPRNQ